MTNECNDKDRASIAEDAKRTRSPLGWTIGGIFLALLLSALFFYDGRDANTIPGAHAPNVVNNPTGSK